MREETLTTWYLQMRSADALRAAPVPEPAPPIIRAEVPLPMLNRFLYTAIGGHWHWRDRLGWSYADWMRWLDRPELETWVLYERGTPAGYIELERQAGDDIEIAYFGLMREFFGRGYGGHLLSAGIARAWKMGARRVWVHSCSLDGPAALANYQARGLTLYHVEEKTITIGDAEGPWPGWDRDRDRDGR